MQHNYYIILVGVSWTTAGSFTIIRPCGVVLRHTGKRDLMPTLIEDKAVSLCSAISDRAPSALFLDLAAIFVAVLTQHSRAT